MTSNYNNSLEKDAFPYEFKSTQLGAIHNKGNHRKQWQTMANNGTKKRNHRSISLLFNLSKVVKEVIYVEVINFVYKRLSKYQCGSRKVNCRTCYP